MTIKVFIAENSNFLRNASKEFLLEDSQIEVIGEAKKGRETLFKVIDLKPDVLILDLLLPDITGLKVLEKLMKTYPTPIILLSNALPEKFDTSVQALLIGAFDFIIKPMSIKPDEILRYREELVQKVILASKSKAIKTDDQEYLLNKRLKLRQSTIDSIFQKGKELYEEQIKDSRQTPSQIIEKAKERGRLSITTNLRQNLINDVFSHGIELRSAEKAIKEIKKAEESDLLDRETELIPSAIKSTIKTDKIENVDLEQIQNEDIESQPKKYVQNISYSEIEQESEEIIKSQEMLEQDLISEKKEIEGESTKIGISDLLKTKTSSIEEDIQRTKLTDPKRIPQGLEDEFLPKKSLTLPKIKPIRNVLLNTGVIVIGASVGGPRTIRMILNGLANLMDEIPYPVLIVQHLGSHFMDSFARTLNESNNLRIKVAEDGEPLRKGIVYVAPGGLHMEITVKKRLPHVRIFKGTPVHFCIPAVDVLFESAAKIYKNKAIGVLLTGMGEDGVMGLGLIQKMGGITIAESEETAVLYGMPRSAAYHGVADYILPNHKIIEFLADNIEKKKN